MSTNPAARGRTRRSVRAGDKLAGATITVGGLGVLAIMLGICVFLVGSAAPLFGSAKVAGSIAGEIEDIAPPVRARIVEGGTQAVVFSDDGVVEGVCVHNGLVWGRIALVEDGQRLVVGDDGERFNVIDEDGSVVTGRVVCDAVPINASAVPEDLRALEMGGVGAVEASEGARAVELTELGWRRWELRVERDAPVRLRGAPAVHAVDSVQVSERVRVVATVHADGSVRRVSARSVARLDGRGGRDRTSTDELAGAFDAGAGLPRWVVQVSNAGVIAAVWEDGRCVWIDAAGEMRVAGETRVADAGERVTVAARALGGNSVLIGTDRGSVSAWTPVREDDAVRLAKTSDSTVGEAGVVSIGAGPRHRTVAVGLSDGSVAVYDPTSGKRLGTLAAGVDIAAVALSPSLGKAAAFGRDGAYRAWQIEPGHPSSTWKSLFGRVHYEGYPGPAHVYQSTGAPGTQPKLSLVPLIWGTLKATIVAMAFAVPLAVLAATYTSEFLHPTWRKTVKPTIELMASLPSVVLGFMAAMVAAPLVRDFLPGILVGFGVVPITVMVGAGVWRLAPRRVTRVTPTWGLALLIAGAVVLGMVLSRALGSAVESVLFAREDGVAEIRAWLDGNYGGAWPGWFLLLTVPALIAVSGAWAWAMATRWNAWTDGMARGRAGVFELVLLAGKVGAGLAIAAGAAWALSALGLDTRDSVFGPFNQRNTLVVGLIMGVAVIPIIYTISEDALRAVPASLRFASLGCGATPWQTTVRVVAPVAASGIFSACMIGLGRAVGETMIVLMATGNTPEMSANIFSGFRTLAANIAVELPEAPRQSTHYHVLFLCGLVLFVMTLAINSTAELVRQRFRKRNAAL